MSLVNEFFLLGIACNPNEESSFNGEANGRPFARLL